VQTSEKALMNHAYKFTGNKDDAADLYQDTLLKALSNLEKFTDNKNIQGWLYTIMKNIFTNNFKRKKLHQKFEQFKQASYSSWSMESTPSDAALHFNELNIIVNQLDACYKVPFEMMLSGHQYEEISIHLNIPVGTVKSRLHQARQKLIKVLES
jgi:RNA polymerase sigma-70 factor (ECF subfamily)